MNWVIRILLIDTEYTNIWFSMNQLTKDKLNYEFGHIYTKKLYHIELWSAMGMSLLHIDTFTNSSVKKDWSELWEEKYELT